MMQDRGGALQPIKSQTQSPYWAPKTGAFLIRGMEAVCSYKNFLCLVVFSLSVALRSVDALVAVTALCNCLQDA